MIVTARNCLVILVGSMLAAFLTACGSNKTTTITSSASPSPIYSHSVAFRNNATFAWGANNFYELGNGDSNGATQSSPQQVVGVGGTGTLAGITGVSAGGSHTLAFNSATGEVFAWGNNYYGELGNASNTISVTPVQVQTTN